MYEIFLSGGPVMYPLLACSIISLTVITERFLFWVRVDMHRNQPVTDEVLELSRVGDWEAVRILTQGSKDYIARILITGILHREYSMAKAMESAVADEIRHMQKYMGVLDTMITVAPLLGIFGTVIGIIMSFEALGSAGIEQPQAVTAGIAQAFAILPGVSRSGITISSLLFRNVERESAFKFSFLMSVPIIFGAFLSK